jgi:hypothetical protein
MQKLLIGLFACAAIVCQTAAFAAETCAPMTENPMDVVPELTLESIGLSGPTGDWQKDRLTLVKLSQHMGFDDLLADADTIKVQDALVEVARKFKGTPQSARWLATNNFAASFCFGAIDATGIPAAASCLWELPGLEVKAPLTAVEGGASCASTSRLLTYVTLAHRFLATWSDACMRTRCKF